MNDYNKIRAIHGLDWNNKHCLHSSAELAKLINTVGFLPIFRNKIKGFSVEEHTAADFWWTKDPEKDPWLWRVKIIQNDELVYGKFFRNKAGFISKKWFPFFANYRRNGYDFDSLYEEGYASNRCKKIMDLFRQKELLSSIDLKQMAGFNKNGEKNFNGVLTELQKKMYLVIRDFYKRKNSKGIEYGFYIGCYSKPETIWGYDYVTSFYKESPFESCQRIIDFIQKTYPSANDNDIMSIL